MVSPAPGMTRCHPSNRSSAPRSSPWPSPGGVRHHTCSWPISCWNLEDMAHPGEIPPRQKRFLGKGTQASACWLDWCVPSFLSFSSLWINSIRFQHELDPHKHVTVPISRRSISYAFCSPLFWRSFYFAFPTLRWTLTLVGWVWGATTSGKRCKCTRLPLRTSVSLPGAGGIGRERMWRRKQKWPLPTFPYEDHMIMMWPFCAEPMRNLAGFYISPWFVDFKSKKVPPGSFFLDVFYTFCFPLHHWLRVFHSPPLLLFAPQISAARPLLMLHYKLLARGIPSHLKGGKEVTRELMHIINQAMDNMEMAIREPSLGSWVTVFFLRGSELMWFLDILILRY